MQTLSYGDEYLPKGGGGMRLDRGFAAYLLSVEGIVEPKRGLRRYKAVSADYYSNDHVFRDGEILKRGLIIYRVNVRAKPAHY